MASKAREIHLATKHTSQNKSQFERQFEALRAATILLHLRESLAIVSLSHQVGGKSLAGFRCDVGGKINIWKLFLIMQFFSVKQLGEGRTAGVAPLCAV